MTGHGKMEIDRVRVLSWIVVVFLLAACGEDQGDPEGLEELSITSWGPSTVLSGTPFTVFGTGFVPSQLGDMTIRIDGFAGGECISYAGTPVFVSEEEIVWSVPADFVGKVAAGGGVMEGILEVRRAVHGYSGWSSAFAPLTLEVADNLKPSIDEIQPDGLYLGDEVWVYGDGLLLPGEGQSVLFLSGEYRTKSPPMVSTLTNVAVPLEVFTRSKAVFTLTPDKLGVRPGDFLGSAWIANVVDGPVEVETLESMPLLGVSLHIYKPQVEGWWPNEVRRGQRVWVKGRGFIPVDPIGETATLILLEGMFETSDGKRISFVGKDAMLLFPETVLGNSDMEVVLRVTSDVNGVLSGLGLVPGKFTGTVRPQLFFSKESVIGSGIDIQLTVKPQLQVVFIKYLPSFDEALHDFGLYPLRDKVKARILERCNEVYSAFNVEFTDKRPVEYAEYSVIELSGEDPNGANLLGLDNTTGKDVNNLRFNDVVGGKNAETEEQGYYSYGGVFLKSFLMFSPTLSNGTTTLASKRFDDIFGGFIPQLGGSELTPQEVESGVRKSEAEEAVRVLGNLVGGTVAHEIGHTLGLAMVPGHPEEYHNLGDNPAWLMDAGNFRPFEERAEIDGQGPEIFAPYNVDYLLSILPKG